MSYLIFKILLIASILSPCVPLFFSIKYRRALNKQLSALFLYLVISIITELIGTLTGKTNIIISLLFTITEYLLIAYIFWLELERKKFRLIIYIFSVLFFILTLYSVLLFNNPNLADDILTTSESVILITLGILYFYKIFTDLDIPKLTNYYFFWVNSAFLLYFSTALFLFLFKSYIKTIEPELGRFLWGIHLIINITSNILLSIGICKHRKT
jgi:hypothetical protein